MTGPFKPEDFADLTDRQMQEILSIRTNALDAKRWACPKGGEHEPGYVWNTSPKVTVDKCKYCRAPLRARWEAV